MKMLSFLGAKAYAVILFCGGLLAVLARNRYLSEKVERETKRRKVAETGLKRKAETEEREAEIHQEWSDYEREAKDDLDKVPDILSKPRRR